MVTITSVAGEQLKGVLEQQGAPDLGLRLFVQSACGCGNVGYGMGLDQTGPGDTTFETEGIRVIMDPGSATLLGGATVDFVSDPRMGHGFVIHTADEAPRAGCGCGAR